jgi:hypothetical protein
VKVPPTSTPTRVSARCLSGICIPSIYGSRFGVDHEAGGRARSLSARSRPAAAAWTVEVDAADLDEAAQDAIVRAGSPKRLELRELPVDARGRPGAIPSAGSTTVSERTA